MTTFFDKRQELNSFHDVFVYLRRRALTSDPNVPCRLYRARNWFHPGVYHAK